jgi:DNA ligase-1
MKTHVHSFIKKEVQYKVMEFKKLTKVFQKLEKTTKRLEMTAILTEFLRKIPTKLLPTVTLLSTGRIFPDYSQKEVGVAYGLMVKAIMQATGLSKKEIESLYKKYGDLGLACEEALKKERQKRLSTKTLTVEKFVENATKASELEGSGTVERKVSLIAEIITSSKPEDAKYSVRLIMGQLRIGIGKGTVRDAIAKAFKVDSKLVEHAWHQSPHYGRIAQIAKKSGEKGLKIVKTTIGEPMMMQLAEKTPNLETVFKTIKNPAFEFKYDGMRTQIHKNEDKIWIYTRRLEDVTKQFPELIKWSRKAIRAKECVVEGETLVINKKTGKPMPFQKLSQRIQRKHDIEKMIKEIPIRIEMFEITYLNGRSFFKKELKKRWKILKKIINPIKGKFELADHIETKDPKKANQFFKKSLKEGHEGLIAKNLDAVYQPGRRVGYWWKVKAAAESLDLAIIGATHGTGKRAGSLSSFILGCMKGNKIVECGMMSTGIKEKGEDMTYKKMTKLLKSYIIKEKGKRVDIKPKIVIEVGYEEIQKSPNYKSGFALRFPRFIRLRTDKSIKQIDTVKRIKYLYKIQKGRK